MKDGARVVYTGPESLYPHAPIRQSSGAAEGTLRLAPGMLGRVLYIDRTPRRRARLWWVEWAACPGACVLVADAHMEET